MQQSKLLKLFYQLHADEFAALKIFIKENCKNKNCIALFDVIVKHYPKKLDTESLNKRTVFAKIFPKENYNDNKLLKVMSELYRGIEQFIIAETIQKDLAYQKLAMLQFYFNHSLDAQIPQEIKELNNYFENQKLASNLFLEKIKFEEIQLSINEKENNRYLSYQALYDSLRNFSDTYLIKLKNLSLINLKDDLVENEPQNPIYLIHTKLNYLLLNDDVGNYDNYFNLVKLHQYSLESKELKTCIIILVDYCIKKVNAKNEIFTTHLFQLFELLIQHNLLLEDNKTITAAIYKNITTIGLRLNKLSFIEQFLEEYKVYLPTENKEDVYLYNKANLLFYQKKYEDVLMHLRNPKFKDVFYKLSSRRLQIKVFYTLLQTDESYFEILQSTNNAFKKYVYTNEEVTENYKEGNKNFLKFTYKLLELNKKQQIKTVSFLTELDTAKQVAEYDWLKENATKFLKK